MPEGHTIHRLAREHDRALAGQVLAVSSPQGRFADSAARLDGRRLERVEAWGKHLFHWWEGDEVLHVHLGLFGRFRRHDHVPPPPPVGEVRVRMVGDRVAVDLSGPTICSLGGPDERERVVARLGPDLLRDDADPERAWRRVSRSRAPIGTLVMDQTVMAGVSNVFRAEALFVCAIAPERQGRSLTREEFDRLWWTLRSMLQRGVEEGRIVTVGEVEARRAGIGDVRTPCATRTYVYKREHCARCGTPVTRRTVVGRVVHACPACQVAE